MAISGSSAPAPPAGGQNDSLLLSGRSSDCLQIQFPVRLLNLKPGTFRIAPQALFWRGGYAAAPKDILFLQEEKGLTYIVIVWE